MIEELLQVPDRSWNFVAGENGREEEWRNPLKLWLYYCFSYEKVVAFAVVALSVLSDCFRHSYLSWDGCHIKLRYRGRAFGKSVWYEHWSNRNWNFSRFSWRIPRQVLSFNHCGGRYQRRRKVLIKKRWLNAKVANWKMSW